MKSLVKILKQNSYAAKKRPRLKYQLTILVKNADLVFLE